MTWIAVTIEPLERPDRSSIRRRAEALAFADTRTLKRALYGETRISLVTEQST